MLDHDQFYTECNKKHKRKEIIENIIFGFICLTLSGVSAFMFLSLFYPEIYLCH